MIYHLIVLHLGNLPPFPPDPRPAQLRRLLQILAWLHGHREAAGAVVFGPGLRAVGKAAKAEAVTSIAVDDDAIDTLRRNSTPVPGRDGVRRDRDGRVWYSARWLGLKS